jgi:OOP family OmpA-OmpF porin
MKRMHDWMPVIAGLFVPVGLLAQPAAAAVKSADQIACELGGECVAAPVAGTDSAGESFDEAPTRGWTFGSKPKAKEKQPEPVAVPRPAQRALPQRPRPVEVSSLDVQFDRGSAQLNDRSLSRVDELYEALRRPGVTGHKYRVVGHTVAVGSAAMNKELSMRRAKAVVDYLASKGLSPAQFEIDGYGDTQPLKGVTGFDPANRRVEIERIN